MIAFEWATFKSAGDDIEDSISLSYLAEPGVPPESRGHGWWALAHNNSLYRHMIRLPTTRANARLPAPWFVNGIYLGRDDTGLPRSALLRHRILRTRRMMASRSHTSVAMWFGTANHRQVDQLVESASIAGRVQLPLGFQTVESVNPAIRR